MKNNARGYQQTSKINGANNYKAISQARVCTIEGIYFIFRSSFCKCFEGRSEGVKIAGGRISGIRFADDTQQS